jgi:hypothetical protein
MNIKNDLRNYVQEQLGTVTSRIFIKRTLAVIEQSPEDNKSLIEAVEKISRLIELFIDTNLAKNISENLKVKINECS